MTPPIIGGDTKFPLCCSRCGTESTRTLDNLEVQPSFPCPSCGALFDCTRVVAEMSRIRGELGHLERGLENVTVTVDFKVKRVRTG